MRKAVVWVQAFIAALTIGTSASAVQLVSDESINLQKQLTTRQTLKNGIPVIVRQIPDSDILQVNVSFAAGLKDLPVGRKALNDWLWGSLSMAGKDYPKEKIFALTEKYGLQLACAGGIELSQCTLETLNDYWGEALPLLASVVKTPALTEVDTRLVRERLIARLKNTPSDPGTYVNEIVNTIFYRPGHPYRLNHDEALKELGTLTRQDLVAYHGEVYNAARMALIVVTSLPAPQVIADLERMFGDVPKGQPSAVKVAPPTFAPDQSYVFHDRELPTAFIRIKLNAPAQTDRDAVATRFLYELLSEELGEEIRTRRSLSYAVHAMTVQYSVGIGMIAASTSRPKETLEAMEEVISRLKTKTFTAEELDEYKNVFATSYYLTQETHASLAQALATALYYFGDPNEHYALPRRLDQVSPTEVKRLANQLLVDPRVGVIFGRADFQDAWGKEFVKKNLSAAAKAPAKK